MPIMTNLTDHDVDTIVRTLYGEARGEPLDGKIGVLHVIKNRSEQPCWWGHSPADVCRMPWQFSCWIDKPFNAKNLAAMLALDEASGQYQGLSNIVVHVFNGEVPDPTGGATHYKVRGTKAQWDAAVIERGLEPISIGAHDFYALGPH